MMNDRRRLWNYLILIGLVAPFLALWALHYANTAAPPANAPRSATTPAANPESPPAAASATASAPAAAPGHPAGGDISLLAAGDGRDLWVMLPVVENNEQRFQLLCRSANTGLWRAAMRRAESGGGGGGGGAGLWSSPTPPRALALMPTPAERRGASSPYLLGASLKDGPGWVWRFSLEGRQPQSPLPSGHTLQAAAAAPDQLFVLTLGPPVAAATHPGDPLRVDQRSVPATRRPAGSNALAPPTAASTPAATASPASALASTTPAIGAASGPAATESATASAPAASVFFNVYWLPPTPRATTAPAAPGTLQPAPGDWCLLTPLGQPSDDAASVPSSSSHIALAEQDGRLMVFWVNPRHPADLILRTLDYTSPQQRWSEPRAIPLAPEEVPALSRLFSLTLDNTLYLLWTVPNGTSLSLHGGWINTDGGTDPALHRISPMPLDSAATGLSVHDVAVGPSENAIVAVVNHHDSGLKTLVFDHHGSLLAKAAPVVPQGPRRDLQIGQNVIMVLLILMMTLALWQWRQKTPEISLPAGTIIAPLHLRAGAFAIDFILPYVAVLLLTDNWANGGYVSTFTSWFSLLSSPENLVKANDLFMFLGLYLGHVTLGELFFRRSVGKALVGLQVLMLDGKAPTVGAVLVRNLVRVPESVIGVIFLYLLMSPRRQRLGDLLARTVVVAQQPPETPADPDKK